MSDAVVVALIGGVLTLVTPIIVLVVGYVLDRKQDQRTREVKRTLDAVEAQNTKDHLAVRLVAEEFLTELREHRGDFQQYREEHGREHELLNAVLHNR
jgi:type II secretory pathway pseudopilin PulG